MKKNSGKFFIGIGVLLVVAGVILFPDDQAIAIIGIILGAYNIVKGARLLRGIQPALIRKQQERDQQVDDELRSQMDESENNRNRRNSNK